jgi:hypothetical protein
MKKTYFDSGLKKNKIIEVEELCRREHQIAS